MCVCARACVRVVCVDVCVERERQGQRGEGGRQTQTNREKDEFICVKCVHAVTAVPMLCRCDLHMVHRGRQDPASCSVLWRYVVSLVDILMATGAAAVVVVVVAAVVTLASVVGVVVVMAEAAISNSSDSIISRGFGSNSSTDSRSYSSCSRSSNSSNGRRRRSSSSSSCSSSCCFKPSSSNS